MTIGTEAKPHNDDRRPYSAPRLCEDMHILWACTSCENNEKYVYVHGAKPLPGTFESNVC